MSGFHWKTIRHTRDTRCHLGGRRRRRFGRRLVHLCAPPYKECEHVNVTNLIFSFDSCLVQIRIYFIHFRGTFVQVVYFNLIFSVSFEWIWLFFIPLGSSLNALSNTFWMQSDPISRSAAKWGERQSAGRGATYHESVFVNLRMISSSDPKVLKSKLVALLKSYRMVYLHF